MSQAPEVPEARRLLVFLGLPTIGPVMRASREAAERLARENAILRRHGAPAFSHGQDPKRTSIEAFFDELGQVLTLETAPGELSVR